MNSNNLIGIISLIAVFVSLLLALFLLTVKTKNKLGNVLLASFIILNGIDLSGWFIFIVTQHFPNLEMFRRSTATLINPVFYLYALAICFTDFKLKPIHLLHAIPFVVYNLLLMPGFYLADYNTKILFFENYRESTALVAIMAFAHLQFTFYIIAIFIVLKRYKKIYLENYTDTTTITYKWLFQLTVIITIVHSIVALKDLLVFTEDSTIFNRAQIIVGINAVFILCWFVLKALYNPDLFRGIDSKLKPVETLIAKNASTSLPLKEVHIVKNNEQIQKLRDYMFNYKPYLEPALTVQDLANQMEMPVRDLSIMINHDLGQHFFDFVNEYRIEKAMEILRDPSQKEFTILEILYKTGFNSKSSFNTSFKKHTNLTPTEYRKTNSR
ncbi:helix-turn-helix domain-containing protein [Pedobacter cryoconitis]|uniref:AraC-like DNA-binding protein n=1 Tax=Pedobacter cryoconitis TaxID=188932 RepID=A0A7X0MJG6_9SPHI|nr:AraC family transcriptional regulator [Pedobacter cryoconitis]MBB6501139.1 AraC-like DNA-binding protein [Pedobacter cryoconitis]